MRSKLLRQISVRLPDDLLEKINARCEEGAISRSSLFRTALENQLGSREGCATALGHAENIDRD